MRNYYPWTWTSKWPVRERSKRRCLLSLVFLTLICKFFKIKFSLLIKFNFCFFLGICTEKVLWGPRCNFLHSCQEKTNRWRKITDYNKEPSQKFKGIRKQEQSFLGERAYCQIIYREKGNSWLDCCSYSLSPGPRRPTQSTGRKIPVIKPESLSIEVRRKRVYRMRAPPGIQTLTDTVGLILQSSGSTNLLGKSERAFLLRRSYWELNEILKVN